ncbi:hypothetical protein [Variovorax sp. LjRoot84]|uniref:hypothetical protein n=1 Tax=Variovorax sp. LjRoot84 TaxID=3342340 RepID=UPI003F50FBA7
MPLDVARLRDSDLASDESPEACWAAVLIWAASWHQVPAASIPDNDNWIAKQAGYAQRGKIAKEWAAVRPGALRGWVLCSDGRYYHPVVAEKARDAWKSKLEQRWKSESARIKKHNQRHGTSIPCLEFDAWIDAGRPQGQQLFVPGDSADLLGDKPKDSGSKRQGERQGQGQRKRKGAKAPSSADELPTWMQSLVALYHEVLPELPGVRVMDKERDQALRDFWDWVLTTKRPDGTARATNPDEALAWVRDYFTRARNNDFIMGRGTRSPDHPNWRCSIEYLLSSRGMKKVIEETQEPA